MEFSHINSHFTFSLSKVVKNGLITNKMPSSTASKSKNNVPGKSLPEALIFASTNPQYDDKLFMKIVSSDYLQNMLCTQIGFFVSF